MVKLTLFLQQTNILTSLEACDRRRDLDSAGKECGQRREECEEQYSYGCCSSKESQSLRVVSHGMVSCGSSSYLEK